MPTLTTYPGVYLEEIPSGVHTITGVATSVTAFVGRAIRGPVDSDDESPVTINSYGDFERIFGGLWGESALGFAVRDFYLNGGSQALIVRLFHSKGGTNDFASLTSDSLNLIAAQPGAWANSLRVRIDYNTRPLPDNSPDPDTFNLTVRDGETGQIEVLRNVSVVAGNLRLVDKVLENESKLVRVNGALPNARPAAHPDPQPGEDVWGDNATPTNSKVGAGQEASDGDPLDEADFDGVGKEGNKEGLYALSKADLFNLLCIPGYKDSGAGLDVDAGLITNAATFCEARRAFLLLDPPSAWTDKDKAKTGFAAGVGTTSKNAAIFFPRLRQLNPTHDNQKEDFVPCGAVAGVMARTDAQRGVWKAPAGLEATLVGVPELSVGLTDAENGELNPLGINCLRAMPASGRVVWGARTLQGDDRLASEWKYIPVRRMALFLEESLYRGTQWVVFEPNDEPLWAQIRLNLGAFMQSLFRQGAFQGKTPKEAYLVKCDSETTTQDDINRGVVNILVGFAPLKPAEFVIIKIQQLAGQIDT
jgi:phage tail sheath protein FI